MTAALMGAIAVVSIVLPGAVVFAWLGAVPMGVLCYRHRIRVALAACVAAGLISFLIAGFGGLVSALTCAYMGAISGQVRRRSRGTATMFTVAALWGVLVSTFCVGVFAALRNLREVVLGAVAANVGGFATLLQGVPVLGRGAAGLDHAVAGWLVHWPWFFGVSVWLIVIFGTSFGWRVLTPVLRRLEEVTDLASVGTLPAPHESTAPGPLPTVLTDVGYRYAGAECDALAPVTMRVDVGEHIAVTGANGTGKSTLMRILAGVPPTTGTVERPAGVGLGQVGGTALVLQHPESQVLGLRVGDDIVWGLPPDRDIDIEGLLTEVGLSGMAGRDTAGLSGGELQRLAVASALAREPALLIADEVTTMVDHDGRQTLINVLDGLTTHHRLGLVHITHYPQEADAADRVVTLGGIAVRPPAELPSSTESQAMKRFSMCGASRSTMRWARHGRSRRCGMFPSESTPATGYCCAAAMARASPPWRGSWRGCWTRRRVNVFSTAGPLPNRLVPLRCASRRRGYSCCADTPGRQWRRWPDIPPPTPTASIARWLRSVWIQGLAGY